MRTEAALAAFLHGTWGPLPGASKRMGRNRTGGPRPRSLEAGGIAGGWGESPNDRQSVGRRRWSVHNLPAPETAPRPTALPPAAWPSRGQPPRVTSAITSFPWLLGPGPAPDEPPPRCPSPTSRLHSRGARLPESETPVPTTLTRAAAQACGPWCQRRLHAGFFHISSPASALSPQTRSMQDRVQQHRDSRHPAGGTAGAHTHGAPLGWPLVPAGSGSFCPFANSDCWGRGRPGVPC